VGQIIPGISGSSHFRNRWVKSFPEFLPGQTTPAIGKVDQMISGIFIQTKDPYSGVEVVSVPLLSIDKIG